MQCSAMYYRLHGLEWCSVDIDATAVQGFGAGLERLCLGGWGESCGWRWLLCQGHRGLHTKQQCTLCYSAQFVASVDRI